LMKSILLSSLGLSANNFYKTLGVQGLTLYIYVLFSYPDALMPLAITFPI
jgi:hypothetical protein